MGVEIARIKNEVRKMAYSTLYRSGILAHKTKVEWEQARHIICTEGELQALYGCSNILYHLKTKSVEGYFRPIQQHVSKTQCVRDAVKEYFEKVQPEQYTEKECLSKTLADKRSFNKLTDVGNYSAPYSRARKFYLTKDTSVVGIETPSSLKRGTDEWKNFILNIDHFLKYVMNAIGRQQRNLGGGRLEFSNANRQMATEAVAKMLGLDYMIPHSEFVVVNHGGKAMHGTLMEVADGESTEGISEERSREVASPALQRELMKLNMLDAITYERDHRPGNYNIILDENGKTSRLSVFDNDAAMTFAPFSVSTHSSAGSSCIVGGGQINRPHLDKCLSENICKLKKHELRQALKPFLNYWQITACWNRVKDLKAAILASSSRDGFLLEADGWNENTMTEELSGKYGRTYLEIFIDNEKINRAFVEYNHVAQI